MTKALNTSVDHSSRQTRREFCACACQAASLLAVGALAGCGGSSNPSGPSNVPTMSVVPSTVSGRVISITVDGSPIAGVGTAAMAQTGLGIFLVAHTGQVVTREQILNQVWGYEESPTTRTIDNFVAKLRQKIETSPHEPEHILTVHGAGYKFVG